MARLFQPAPEFPAARVETVLGNDPPPGIDNKTQAKEDQRDYSEAELLEEARSFLDRVSTDESDNRNRAAEMLRFCYKRGNQWPDKIRRMRENEDRPVLEINQMPRSLIRYSMTSGRIVQLSRSGPLLTMPLRKWQRSAKTL